jgi:putative transposase
MPRLARIVLPGAAHHLIQRGNRRQAVFFLAEDRQAYLKWLADASQRWRLRIWAYCLMTNHVHLVAVPETAEGLARCMAQVHSRYARRINARMRWRGHLWQARFGSSVMDASYTLAAVRYVEQNPVRAGLVQHAWEYPWSSAAYHVGTRVDDPIVTGEEGLRAEIGNWREFLEVPETKEHAQVIRRNTPVCRPLGTERFIHELEASYGIRLRRGRPGRPPCEKIVPVPD